MIFILLLRYVVVANYRELVAVQYWKWLCAWKRENFISWRAYRKEPFYDCIILIESKFFGFSYSAQIYVQHYSHNTIGNCSPYTGLIKDAIFQCWLNFTSVFISMHIKLADFNSEQLFREIKAHFISILKKNFISFPIKSLKKKTRFFYIFLLALNVQIDLWIRHFSSFRVE